MLCLNAICVRIRIAIYLSHYSSQLYSFHQSVYYHLFTFQSIGDLMQDFSVPLFYSPMITTITCKFVKRSLKITRDD